MEENECLAPITYACTQCLIQKDDKVLLINRPDKLGFPGYLGPGGKVEFPESISEGAVREVLRRQD